MIPSINQQKSNNGSVGNLIRTWGLFTLAIATCASISIFLYGENKARMDEKCTAIRAESTIRFNYISEQMKEISEQIHILSTKISPK